MTPDGFTCPGCGRHHAMATAALPVGGSRGRCSCGLAVIVHPDGVAEPVPTRGAPPSVGTATPPPTSPATPETGDDHPSRLLLKRPSGRSEAVPTSELRRRLALGRVRPVDHVSVDGVSFLSIADLEGFEDLETTAPEADRFCANHPRVPGTSCCRSCGRTYCPGCVPPRRAAPSPPIQCPACDGLLVPADLRWNEKPFWGRIAEVLLYGLRDKAWITTLGIGVLYWMGFFLFPITAAFWFLALAFVVHVVNRSAHGEKRMTDGPDFSDIPQLIGKGLQAALVTGVIVGAFFALNVWVLSRTLSATAGSGEGASLFLLNIPLAILAVLYYPMALGLVAVWQSWVIPFRPDIVFRYIFRIPGPYAAVVAAFVILAGLGWLAQFAAGLLPVIGIPISRLAEAWVFVTQAHVIGWTLYLHEERLGWS